MNIKMQDENSFRTSDFALAVTLSLFKPLNAIERTDSHRAYFVFGLDNELEELIEKFWSRRLLLEPRAFFDQIKATKSRLYGQN